METAWRAPARISRKGCSSAGRGCPKRRSHASDPNPMTQESPPSRSRNSTARTSAARSPHNERRVARFSGPGLSVATRKIAARVSGAATACARAGDLRAASGVFVGSGFIGYCPCDMRGIPLFEMRSSRRTWGLAQQAYHRLPNVHPASRHTPTVSKAASDIPNIGFNRVHHLIDTAGEDAPWFLRHLHSFLLRWRN